MTVSSFLQLSFVFSLPNLASHLPGHALNVKYQLLPEMLIHVQGLTTINCVSGWSYELKKLMNVFLPAVAAVQLLLY